MSKSETLHVRVNEGVKSRAENTLNLLGLSISEAVNILLHQISLVGGLPFEVKIPPAPENVMVNSKDELYQKLNIGIQQIKDGKVINANTALTQLREKHGF